MCKRKYISVVGLLAVMLLSLAPARGQSVKLLFAGDLMGHGPQIKAAQRADGSYDYTPCFRNVKDYVQSADLAILNLEVTLAGAPYTGYPQFSSPRELALAARDAGFDVMTTANNHCMDRGRKGLERTLQVLDTLGIPHLGTYRDRGQRDREHPLMLQPGGIRLALLCYTYGTNGIPPVEPNVVNMIDTAEMARDLRVARERGAEYIVTLIHWGVEYATHSNREQEQTARWLLEHGSDAVIGGHPHVVQNFTLDARPDNDRPTDIVVYSMGNLVSNQRDVNCDGGIMVELTLERDADSQVVARQCGYMPYWVHRGTVDGLYQYYIVPSADASAHPESYQIAPADRRALQTFDAASRSRLEACRLPDGRNIEEVVFYRDSRRIYPPSCGVVPLRSNPAIGSRMAQ